MRIDRVVLTTTIEMVEIRVGKRSVGKVKYVINWSHFTRGLYLHSPWARENADATHKITRHISR